jgi:hypothetical protein
MSWVTNHLAMIATVYGTLAGLMWRKNHRAWFTGDGKYWL